MIFSSCIMVYTVMQETLFNFELVINEGFHLVHTLAKFETHIMRKQSCKSYKFELKHSWGID